MIINKREKIIGVVGGMGPEATLDFFKKIIRNTEAKRDQDHLRIIIYNNPKIPDRTPAVLGTGKSIIPDMVKTAKSLEKAGASFIVIPCVTAHYFIDDFRKQVNIPIISLIEELGREIVDNYSYIKKVGLLATSGTIKGGHVQNRLEKLGIQILIPSEDLQEELVMEAIYGKKGIKAGYINYENKEKFIKITELLIKKGAEGIIAGCTEIPLVLKQNDIPIPLFDTILILAKAAIREATQNQ